MFITPLIRLIPKIKLPLPRLRFPHKVQQSRRRHHLPLIRLVQLLHIESVRIIQHPLSLFPVRHGLIITLIGLEFSQHFRHLFKQVLLFLEEFFLGYAFDLFKLRQKRVQQTQLRFSVRGTMHINSLRTFLRLHRKLIQLHCRARQQQKQYLIRPLFLHCLTILIRTIVERLLRPGLNQSTTDLLIGLLIFRIAISS